METLTITKGDQGLNHQAAKILIQEYPIILDILKLYNLEDFAIRYAIHDIWVDQNRFTFYFYQSCTSAFNKDNIHLLLEHNVMIQFPGNQNYNFSISFKL